MSVFKKILLACYLLLLVISTFFLFTFNEFSCSNFGKTTIIGLKEKLDDYHRGNLLIISNKENPKKGDQIIYYDSNLHNKVNISEVTNIIKNAEDTYILGKNMYLSDEYLIGKQSEITSLPLLGYLYNILTNKIGYLILFIIPIVICFIINLKKYLKHEKN